MNFSIDNNHWLQGEWVLRTFTATKNKQTYEDIGGKLDTIVIHYTGGRSAETSAKYLAQDNVGASAHLVIGRQGDEFRCFYG